jgi:hypothetical protein
MATATLTIQHEFNIERDARVIKARKALDAWPDPGQSNLRVLTAKREAADRELRETEARFETRSVPARTLVAAREAAAAAEKALVDAKAAHTAALERRIVAEEALTEAQEAAKVELGERVRDRMIEITQTRLAPAIEQAAEAYGELTALADVVHANFTQSLASGWNYTPDWTGRKLPLLALVASWREAGFRPHQMKAWRKLLAECIAR